MDADERLMRFVSGVSRTLDPSLMAEPAALVALTDELQDELSARPGHDRRKNRVVDVPGCGILLSGPRAYGGDRTRPFVDVVAWSFDPIDETHWDRLAAAARGEHRHHGPRLRVRVSPPAARALAAFADVEGDLHVMSERIDRLRARPRPAESGRVAVVPITRDNYYERYRKVHEAFREADPVLRDRVSISSHPSLEVARAAGLLYDVIVDGAWAGLIAARPGRLAGAAGYVVEEEILVAEHRGRGLGAAMQRAFVDRLDGSGGRHLVGTIDVANVASRRTAERVGRREIARYVFV